MLVALVTSFALVGAPAAQPKAAAAAPVLSVRVDAASADAATKAAAEELRAAIGARKDEFRLVKVDEKPELVVRVDGQKTLEGKSAMIGALSKGQTVRPFSLTYPGDLKALAAALARNLRGLADQIKPSPAPSK